MLGNSPKHSLRTFWLTNGWVWWGNVIREGQSVDPVFWNICDCYSFYGISVKHSGVDMHISIYKAYVSEFWFRWPEVRSILWLHDYKEMEECWHAIYSKSTTWSMLFISRFCYIRPLSMTYMQFWPSDISFGFIKIIGGQIRFWPLTFDRREIQHWGWF